MLWLLANWPWLLVFGCRSIRCLRYRHFCYWAVRMDSSAKLGPYISSEESFNHNLAAAITSVPLALQSLGHGPSHRALLR